MDGHATLVVRRKRRWFGVMRQLRILLDGAEALTLRNGKSASLEVAAGEHRLQAAMDWCSSNELRVHCASGQRVVVDCDVQSGSAKTVRETPDQVFRLSLGS